MLYIRMHVLRWRHINLVSPFVKLTRGFGDCDSGTGPGLFDEDTSRVVFMSGIITQVPTQVRYNARTHQNNGRTPTPLKKLLHNTRDHRCAELSYNCSLIVTHNL